MNAYIYSHTEKNADEWESSWIQPISKTDALDTKKNTFLTEMGRKHEKKTKESRKWDRDEVRMVAQSEISISSQVSGLHSTGLAPSQGAFQTAVPPSPPLWPVEWNGIASIPCNVGSLRPLTSWVPTSQPCPHNHPGLFSLLQCHPIWLRNAVSACKKRNAKWCRYFFLNCKLKTFG